MTGITDLKMEQARQRKFQKYFPSDPFSLKKIYDDLINCDYNLIGIWTKANAVRDIYGIDDDEIAESVVALLFSPEELLQEEAARSIAGSGRKLYDAVAERIPERARNKLEGIVSNAIVENELIFEKIKFLSSCFPGIYEDELLSLGKGLIYKNDIPDQIPASSDGSIMWCFSERNTLSGVFMLDNDSGKDIIDDIGRKGCSSFYILNLDTLEEFRFLYPGSSWKFYDILIIMKDNQWPDMTPIDTTSSKFNPFPGLRPFIRKKINLFWRDSESEEIAGKLLANKFIAVTGASGIGKSSLLCCGLYRH